MIELGYKLCSEEHEPNELVRFAQRAKEVGFSFGWKLQEMEGEGKPK